MAWGSLQALIAKFAPMAILDSQEVNFPASTEDYVPLVGYMAANGDDYYAPGKWHWNTVTLTGNAYLVVPGNVPSTFKGGNVDHATAYVHVQAVKGLTDVVDIQYWLFYNYNGAETLRAEAAKVGPIPLGSSGEMALPQSYHWGDWECVIVRVNSDEQVLAVCFSQHSGQQWCLPGEFSFKTETQQPNVYVSRGSHANRPAPGGPFWIGGIDLLLASWGAVDYADGKGKTVDYSKSFVLVANDAKDYFTDAPPDPGWLKFEGKWGQDLDIPTTAGEIVNMVWLAAKSVPAMLPFVGYLAAIAGGAATMAAPFVGMLYTKTNDAPTNPPTKGLWLNSLPLVPPVASWFAPSLAAFDTSTQENQLYVAAVGPYVGGLVVPTVQLVTCSTEDGEDWSALTWLKQTSLAGPCLVPFNGGLCVAFTSSDGDANLYTCLSADGVTWSKNYSTGQKSPTAPALAEFNGQLWLAFMANDNSKQNRLLKCSSTDGQKWTTDVQVPGQFTKTGPALASFNGRLWVAFISSNDFNQILICSSADGETWTDNAPVPGASATSTYAPSLAVLNTNQLWLAFTNPAGNVMVCSSPDGQGWTAPTPIPGQLSKTTPSLTIFDETLWVAFIANSTASQVVLCSSPDGQNWSDNALIYPTPS